MGQQVVNPQTGEVFELQGKRWVPVKAEKAQPAAPTEKLELIDNPLQGALIAAGDQFATMGRNVRDVYAGLRGDEAGQLAIEDEREEAGRFRQLLHEERPYSAFVGSILPTAPLALLSGGATLPATMAGRGAMIGRAAGGNAALGALQSESGDYLSDAAMGGAFSLGGSGASSITKRVWEGRKAIQGARQAGAQAANLTDEEGRILAGAERAGMTVLPGQRAGDRTMRQFEAALSSNPMTGRVFQDIEQANNQQLNRLAARAMGVEADDVGAVTRAAAEHQLSKRFEQIGRDIGPVDTAPLRRSLDALAKEETTALLPRTELDNIMARFERGSGARATAVAGEGTDQVSGQALMRERSRIAKQMRDAYARNDSSAGDLYGSVLDAMDEAAKSAAIRSAKGDPSAGEALARSYDSAREQWSVLRAMDRGGASIDGNVMPGQAARLMRSSDKRGFQGRANDIGETTQVGGSGRIGDRPLGDFYDALRFKASQIGRPIVGDSGTATRSAISNWLNSGSTLPTVAVGMGNMVRRLTASPLAQAYTQMSPQAAQTMLATYAAMKNPGFSPGLTAAGQAGARIAPFIGGQ